MLRAEWFLREQCEASCFHDFDSLLGGGLFGSWTLMPPTTPKGVRLGGRAKGTPNKVTSLLKDAILRAATLEGRRLKVEGAVDRDGLVGFLADVARHDRRSFCMLLGKVLPMTVEGSGERPMRLIIEHELPDGDSSATGASLGDATFTDERL